MVPCDGTAAEWPYEHPGDESGDACEGGATLPRDEGGEAEGRRLEQPIAGQDLVGTPGGRTGRGEARAAVSVAYA